MYQTVKVLNSKFEAEVLPHLSSLQKTALRLKRNQMDADDLVQETLLRALNFWDQFTPGTNCRAWLLRILNNQHINEWRAISRRAISVRIDLISEADLAFLAQASVQISSPEQDMISQALDDDLYSALYQLEGKFRKIILMYFFMDLSYRQIARLTNLCLGTVKSRLYRGRQLLRKGLNKYAIYNRHVTQNRH